jgi:hypothetical protein
MRDGTKLYADVFRPASGQKTPTLVFWSPFGKHGAVPPALFENMGVDFSTMSEYTMWELPDPIRWVPWGYSFVIIDPRGTWYSEGITLRKLLIQALRQVIFPLKKPKMGTTQLTGLQNKLGIVCSTLLI